MVSKTQYLFIGSAIALTNAACAATEPYSDNAGQGVTASIDECEEAIEAFGVEPTFRQDGAARRRLLGLIRSAQLERYGQSCDSLPNWRERFDAAYQSRYDESWKLDYSPEAVVILEDDQSSDAEPECYDHVQRYSDAISTYIDGDLSKSRAKAALSLSGAKLSKTECQKDSELVLQYRKLRSDAVLIGLLPGPVTRIQ